jgi:uronate dehydrogenase
VIEAALQDRPAVAALLQGMDAVVHLGGLSTEHPFDAILQANILGTYNVYEAARRHGVKRIVYASSNHVTGFYRQDQVIDATLPARPDGYYGLSKAFGEDLARFYFDRYGIEIRVPAHRLVLPRAEGPPHARHLAQLRRPRALVLASLTAPVVGHSIVYGLSDNKASWWDNTPPATWASGRRTVPSPSAPRAKRRSRAGPRRPGRDLPGRRLRAHGPVRMKLQPQANRGEPAMKTILRALPPPWRCPAPRPSTPRSSVPPTSTRRLPTVLAVRHMGETLAKATAAGTRSRCSRSPRSATRRTRSSRPSSARWR